MSSNKETKKDKKISGKKVMDGSKKALTNFKDFALKGNVIDMAVGVIIGAAFGKIVTSIVNDVLMPIISMITGKIDFTNLFVALDGNTYATLEQAKAAGVATLNYGLLITTIIDFIIVALSIYIVINNLQKIGKKKEETPVKNTKQCPYCKTDIHKDAVKCPNCTSDIKK